MLLNPRSLGGRAARLTGPLQAWLARHAADVQLHVIDGIDRARATIAAQPRAARVVLVGGDGTVHRMLPALLERDCTLALVPMGSGNDTARALGVAGLAWTLALEHALAAPAAPMDLGEFVGAGNRFCFASSLTAGFDSAVAFRAMRVPRWLRGLPRYLVATLREIAALRTWPTKVEADGKALHDGPALFVSVLNTPTYGSGMPAVPAARIDDGQLDVLVAGQFSRAGTARMLPRLLAGRHLGDPRVKTSRFTLLSVESDVEVPIAGDGENAGSASSWTIRVLPGALGVAARPASPATMASR